MEIIPHILILLFGAVVIIGVVSFLVIDVFGRIDYLKDKAPWLQRVLERRGALGVLVLVAIFLLLGTGYELLIKEVPEVPAAPTVTVKGPIAPEISRCTVIRVLPEGEKSSQLQTCPPQTVTSQPDAPVRQSSPPQTPLERLTELNKNLPKGDRDRLANAFFEYAQFLDQGPMLRSNVDVESGLIRTGWQDGSIAKTVDVHIKKMHELDASAWAYSKAFRQVRDKWKYYPDQTDYIFGDNPDNPGPNTLINGIEEYVNFLERWSKIQNKDQQEIRFLLADESNRYDEWMMRFSTWLQGCQQRLGQIKKSIQ